MRARRRRGLVLAVLALVLVAAAPAGAAGEFDGTALNETGENSSLLGDTVDRSTDGLDNATTTVEETVDGVLETGSDEGLTAVELGLVDDLEVSAGVGDAPDGSAAVAVSVWPPRGVHSVLADDLSVGVLGADAEVPASPEPSTPAVPSTPAASTGGGADPSNAGSEPVDAATPTATPVPDAGPAAPAVRTPAGGVAPSDRPDAGHGGPVDPGATGTAVAGVGAVAAATTLGGGSGVEREVGSSLARSLERTVRLIAPLRYSRHDGSDPLAHDVRADIHDRVADAPGTYVSVLSEDLPVSHSSVRHHVRILESEGLVETAKVRGRRRLFPARFDHQELSAALADDATAAVLGVLATLGPSTGGTVAEEVDRSRPTVSHHLSRLAEDGLVVRERDGRAVVNRLADGVAETLAGEPATGADEAGVGVRAD